MTQAGKKKKRAANRSILLAKKIIIKDGGTVSWAGGESEGRREGRRGTVGRASIAWEARQRGRSLAGSSRRLPPIQTDFRSASTVVDSSAGSVLAAPIGYWGRSPLLGACVW